MMVYQSIYIVSKMRTVDFLMLNVTRLAMSFKGHIKQSIFQVIVSFSMYRHIFIKIHSKYLMKQVTNHIDGLVTKIMYIEIGGMSS